MPCQMNDSKRDRLMLSRAEWPSAYARAKDAYFRRHREELRVRAEQLVARSEELRGELHVMSCNGCKKKSYRNRRQCSFDFMMANKNRDDKLEKCIRIVGTQAWKKLSKAQRQPYLTLAGLAQHPITEWQRVGARGGPLLTCPWVFFYKSEEHNFSDGRKSHEEVVLYVASRLGGDLGLCNPSQQTIKNATAWLACYSREATSDDTYHLSRDLKRALQAHQTRDRVVVLKKYPQNVGDLPDVLRDAVYPDHSTQTFMDEPTMFDFMRRRVAVRRGCKRKAAVGTLQQTVELHDPSSDISGLKVFSDSPQPPTASVAKPHFIDAGCPSSDQIPQQPPIVAVAKPHLADTEWLQREVIKRARGDLNNTACLRDRLKKKMKQEDIQQPAQALLDAVHALTKAGLLDSWTPKKQHPGGCPVVVFRKMLWRQVASQATAIAAVARLNLSAHHFPDGDVVVACETVT